MQPPLKIEVLGVEILRHAVRRWGRDTAAYAGQIGHVRPVLSPCGGLILFTYTDKAQWAGVWTPEERVARGLILDAATAEVVARPWPKFHNLGERPETQLAALPVAGGFEVTEKLDGSLGIGYWRDGDWHVATRGSFASEQAAWATAWLRGRLAGWGHETLRRLTYLFEIIYPANRVVLDYGERANLTLIGVRTRKGWDFGHADVAEVARLAGLQAVPRHEVADLDALADLAGRETGVEGWVVRFADGFRVKVKTAEYLALHKLVSGLTPARVRDAILDGTVDDYIRALPDEFAREAGALRREIAERAVRRTDALYAAYEALMVEHRAPRTDGAAAEGPLTAREARKAFALRAQAAAAPSDLPFLFHLYERRPIGEAVLKAIDLPRASGLVGRLAGAGAP